MSGQIYPFASREDLEDELADIDRALARLEDGYIVNEAQREARRGRLLLWRQKIADQLGGMSAAAVKVPK
jgi:hypothetical protein